MQTCPCYKIKLLTQRIYECAPIILQVVSSCTFYTLASVPFVTVKFIINHALSRWRKHISWIASNTLAILWNFLTLCVHKNAYSVAVHEGSFRALNADWILKFVAVGIEVSMKFYTLTMLHTVPFIAAITLAILLVECLTKRTHLLAFSIWTEVSICRTLHTNMIRKLCTKRVIFVVIKLIKRVTFAFKQDKRRLTALANPQWIVFTTKRGNFVALVVCCENIPIFTLLTSVKQRINLAIVLLLLLFTQSIL